MFLSFMQHFCIDRKENNEKFIIVTCSCVLLLLVVIVVLMQVNVCLKHAEGSHLEGGTV